MKNFRTYNLAVDFYRQTQCLKLPGFIKNQLNRAALSIVLNLAEGRGKPSKAEQLRFFHIAMGSLRESQAILELIQLTNSPAVNTANILGAHLYKLIQNAR